MHFIGNYCRRAGNLLNSLECIVIILASPLMLENELFINRAVA